MNLSVPSDYLPVRKRWRLKNHDGNAPFQVPLTFRTENQRVWLDLGTTGNFVPTALVDGLSITPSTVELHGLRCRSGHLDIRPSFAVPLGGAATPVSDAVFGTGPCLGGTAPHRGFVINNEVKDETEGETLRFSHWRFVVSAKSAEGDVQFKITLDFVNGLGLRLCQGQMAGGFFSYQGLLAVDGVWLLPEQRLTLELSQDGPLVAGHFERPDSAGEVIGHFDGEVFYFDWRAFATSTQPENFGTGELALTDDGESLAGEFEFLGLKTPWKLQRPPKPPPPAPYVDPLAFLKKYHSKPHPGTRPYEDYWTRMKYKESWDRYWKSVGRPEGANWWRLPKPL